MIIMKKVFSVVYLIILINHYLLIVLINKLAEKFENFVMINLKNLNTNLKTKDNISKIHLQY